MKRFVALLSVGLSLLWLTPAVAQTNGTTRVVGTCGTAVYTAGKFNYPTQDTTGAACGSGGSGGGASFTAEATATSVAAGTNKPGGIDTANKALRTEVCVPGSTTCYDPTSPGGVTGVNGSSIATVANPFPIQNVSAATGGASPSHAIVANNTTSVAIDASPGTLYSVQVFNNSATIAYLKLYDAAQGSTTCGSGTPKKVILIPASTSGAGAVIPLGGSSGLAFATAITRCVTTGIADNDTGAPAASAYLVEADFK